MQGEGFDVMKSGDARVALIGFPSVGKVSIAPTYVVDNFITLVNSTEQSYYNS